MENKKVQTTSIIQFNIAAALVLAAAKFAAGLLTNSMAVMASALDSAMDVATSVINFIAAHEAAKPPDKEHAYGHGKIESLASLFQSVLIGLGGLFLVVEATKRLIAGSLLTSISTGIWVMIFSILVSGLIVWRMSAVGRESTSLILSTERLHFTMDILSNGGVILTLLLVQMSGQIFWDLLVSIGISIYIFKVSFQIMRRSIDELLDRGLPEVSKEEIENLIRGHHASIVGLHNFRSRKVGEKVFLDFHIEIRGEENFNRAHDMTESLIAKIQSRYEGADITVHFDPEGAA